jgi:hypothetical protein
MTSFTFTSPEGKSYTVQGPAGATQEQAFAILQSQNQEAQTKPQTMQKEEERGKLASIGGGLGSGVGRVVLGAQDYVGEGLNTLGLRDVGQWLMNDARQGREKLKQEIAPYKEANPMTTGAAEIGGEILATLPFLRAAGAAANAAGATRLGTAIASSGATTGQTVAKTAPIAQKAADLAIRTAGGGIGGGLTASLSEPGTGGTGAIIGAALPGATKIIGYGANSVGGIVRPFFSSGQNKIVKNVLSESAANPQNALRQLLNAAEVVPGSSPTTAMAAGDDGIAALSRAMQSADPRFAAELSARQTAQNQARTVALQGIAGNEGKIGVAKAARKALTDPMRESVLDAAGSVQSGQILDQIDDLIKSPNNAGRLAQQALGQFRSQIADLSQDGAINARALYEVRKDIGQIMQGKLQGEAGNLRYARSQLDGVQSLIDDAIDQASRRVAHTGMGLSGAAPTGAVGEFTGGVTGQVPRSSWRDYLQSYAKESIPINQMEKLEGVLKSIQTGTVDSQGGLVLSAAKLNNIIKNEGGDLAKSLAPEQLDVLRRISADLNASQISANAGRAVGSNTVQNLSQTQILRDLLGQRMGGSTPANALLGRVLQLPYGMANKQMQEKLGNALLDPKLAAQLMSAPENNALMNVLANRTVPMYRAAPLLNRDQ